jgi:predicted nucleic acid-binding Zn ribbon protein
MDKNGNKTKESVPIGSVLKNILKNLRHDSDEDLTQVWQLWDEVVGIAIAENAQPAAFKGKLLLVNVISSTWIHQLQFLKKDIIEKLNIALGQDLIEDIKFKIGPL